MGGIALNITVLGYGGLLEYGILACAKKLPDLSGLRDLLEDEANMLLKSPREEADRLSV
jgi:hypothetical protein